MMFSKCASEDQLSCTSGKNLKTSPGFERLFARGSRNRTRPILAAIAVDVIFCFFFSNRPARRLPLRRRVFFLPAASSFDGGIERARRHVPPTVPEPVSSRPAFGSLARRSQRRRFKGGKKLSAPKKKNEKIRRTIRILYSTYARSGRPALVF